MSVTLDTRLLTLLIASIFYNFMKFLGAENGKNTNPIKYKNINLYIIVRNVI
jgi:hypothetical protein